MRFYEKSGKAPDPWTRHEILISDVIAALKDQGTTPRQGDIFMIRSGYVRRHNLASAFERKQGTCDNTSAIGLKADEDTIRWLYDQHFSAHVGDTVAFEAWPPAEGSIHVIHEWSLVWW